MQTIYGLHDAGGEQLMLDAGRPGWVVITEAISRDPNDRTGRDYRYLSDRGLGVIVRLNCGYGSTGTIPTPEHYEAFARRCANFVAASRGCTRWIIGNEPNHAQERPDGQEITPYQYAECYAECREAIKAVQPDAEVLVAAVAPWNMQSGDWLDYWRKVLRMLGSGIDGYTIHAYTHGADSSLPASDEHRNGWYWHLRVYKQLLAEISPLQRHAPCYITESNQGDNGWVDVNSGWVQAAYAEINQHNQSPAFPKIQCLCLYRWPRFDQWHIEGKQGVIEDFKAALQHGYRVPDGVQAGSGGSTIYVPVVSTKPAPVSPIEWDERLTQRGTTIERAQVAPGQQVWRVTKGRFFDEQESGGRRHIYWEPTREGQRQVGLPVRVEWDGESVIVATEAKPGERYGGNYGMTPGRYSIQVADGLPSDRVIGIQMGAQTPGGWNAGIHTSSGFDIELVTEPQPVQPPTPPPPTPPAPVANGIIDPIVAQAILNIESGAAFGPSGKPIIRFETHIFRQRLDNDAVWSQYFRHGSPSWTGQEYNDGSGWKALHSGTQADEYAALELAERINRKAAYESMSVGRGQIMGFNHARIGYPSAPAMYDAFAKTEAAQILGFINYALSDPDLVAAMRNRDWRTIAAKYNGPGNVDRYAALLEAEYRRLAQ